MAKKKLKNYIFQKGIPKTGNNYPIAWNLLDKNVEYLKDEMLGYIKEKGFEILDASNYYERNWEPEEPPEAVPTIEFK